MSIILILLWGFSALLLEEPTVDGMKMEIFTCLRQIFKQIINADRTRDLSCRDLSVAISLAAVCGMRVYSMTGLKRKFRREIRT